MPTYKLNYFDGRGLCEPIRFLFSYGGVDYEDDRFQPEEWPQLKSQMPFGRAPVLEVDGKRIDQSSAICRYLAKQFGLAGKDDWENLEIDAIVDTFHDFRAALGDYHYEKNQAAKEAKRVLLFQETIPFYLDRFDAQVKKNRGYFVGGKLTWADLAFVGLLDYLDYMAEFNLVDKHENLKSLKNKVLDIPQIKYWVDKRPKDQF